MTKLHHKYIDYIRAIVAGTIAGMFIFFGNAKPPVRSNAIEVIPEMIPTATPTPTWNDAIRQVFPKDEAGRMIRICMAENKGQDKYALNYNTNGTVDASWCQVNSCHKPKDMTMDKWLENLTDPEFHAKEVRKIYLSQGWSAWVVSRWVK